MERKYYSYTKERLCEGRIPTRVMDDSQAVFRAMAQEMADTIEENSRKGDRSVLIVPVGPVGQYPHFVQLVKERRISLKDCWIINMDEYLGDDGKWIDPEPYLYSDYLEETMSYEEFKTYMAQYEAEQAAKTASGWAANTWDKLTDEGIFDGTKPQAPLTRQEAAAVICRMRKEE